MQLDGLWQASEDVVSREVAGEMVLLDLSSGTYFGLNRVGSRVWERLSESACSVRQLSQMIESEFEAPYDVIEKDIVELTRSLVDKGLIREAL